MTDPRPMPGLACCGATGDHAETCRFYVPPAPTIERLELVACSECGKPRVRPAGNPETTTHAVYRLLHKAARWLAYLDDPKADDVAAWLAEYERIPTVLPLENVYRAYVPHPDGNCLRCPPDRLCMHTEEERRAAERIVNALDDAALPASPEAGLDVERKRYAAALREIADWNAHSDDCPGYHGGDVCSCGWVEIADVARTALDPDGTALLEVTPAALKEPNP